MKKISKNKFTVLWYAHPRVAIALMLIGINLVIIFTFTAILACITKNSFFQELAYIFAFTMSSDGIYDFVNSNDDLICFVLKIVLAIIQMIIFSGSLIGFTTDLLQSTIDSKLNNVGKMKLTDHYVFLNWSAIGPRVIYDLSFLEGEKNIVILSTKDREEILTSIENVFTENKRKMQNVRVFVKEGNPMSSKHLHDISIENAKYIAVLLANIENDENKKISLNDLNAIKTLFSMMNLNINANIVVEVEENNTSDKIEELLNIINPQLERRISTFSHNSVVGHILGRAIINPTFNTVFYELLSYEGVEFYGIPTMDIEEALYKFNDCIPIINYYDDGLVDEEGKKAADQLYVLSDDEQSLGIRNEPKKFIKPLKFRVENEREEFTVFIISEDNNARFIIEELDKYAITANIHVNYQTYSYNDDINQIKENIKDTKGFKKVLLLSNITDDGMNQDADVFLTALDLKMDNELGENVQIYAEILNPNNIIALQNLGVASVIVSSQIISLFMVQLLTHSDSKRFYRDLISINGGIGDDNFDIDIVKAKEILEFDESEIIFSCQSELVQSFYLATNKTRMCIGFKKQNNDNVHFLCDKMDVMEEIILNPEDELVLIVY